MNKKPKRNDPCPCGSGRKYKQCCWGNEQPKSDMSNKSFFAQKLNPTSTSSLKRKFSAKLIKSEKTEEQNPAVNIPDPIEKTFSKTLETIRSDELPPAPPSDTIPEQKIPTSYKRWDPKK